MENNFGSIEFDSPPSPPEILKALALQAGAFCLGRTIMWARQEVIRIMVGVDGTVDMI